MIVFPTANVENVQYSNSNTVVHVVKVWELFLKTVLPVVSLYIMITSRVFRRNRFVRHPPSRLRSLCKPRRQSWRGTRLRSRCVARGFRLSTRASESSVNPKIRTPDLVITINSTMIRLLAAAVLSPKNPLFHSAQTSWRIQTRVLPNRK